VFSENLHCVTPDGTTFALKLREAPFGLNSDRECVAPCCTDRISRVGGCRSYAINWF
jgi:hypothetical protein